MKLFVKATLYAVAFVAALFFLMKGQEDHGELHLWEFSIEEIQSVAITSVEQKYQVKREQGKWKIDIAGDSWEGDENAISLWLRPLLHPHAKAILGGSKEAILNYEDYGLVNPSSRIIIHLNAGKKWELLIGRRSPLGDSYYVQPAGVSAVYLLSIDELREFLDGKVERLKAKASTRP